MSQPGEIAHQTIETRADFAVSGKLAESSLGKRLWSYEAEIGSVRVGYADLGFSEDGKQVEIDYFSIAKEYRGMGYGSPVYQDLIDRLITERKGLERVVTTTDEKAMVKIRSNLKPPQGWEKSYTLVPNDSDYISVSEDETDRMMECLDNGGWVRFTLSKQTVQTSEHA